MPIEKIIVLEDDLVVRKNLEQQLRYKRFDVASASTIAEAQELLTKDNFDLMIVDVRLPDGKGTDLLRQLQTRRCNWRRPTTCVAESWRCICCLLPGPRLSEHR